MYSLIEAALLCANLKQILQFCNDKMKVNIIENLAQCALTGEKVKAQTRTHIHRHRHRHTHKTISMCFSLIVNFPTLHLPIPYSNTGPLIKYKPTNIRRSTWTFPCTYLSILQVHRQNIKFNVPNGSTTVSLQRNTTLGAFHIIFAEIRYIF